MEKVGECCDGMECWRKGGCRDGGIGGRRDVSIVGEMAGYWDEMMEKCKEMKVLAGYWDGWVVVLVRSDGAMKGWCDSGI